MKKITLLLSIFSIATLLASCRAFYVVTSDVIRNGKKVDLQLKLDNIQEIMVTQNVHYSYTIKNESEINQIKETMKSIAEESTFYIYDFVRFGEESELTYFYSDNTKASFIFSSEYFNGCSIYNIKNLDGFIDSPTFDLTDKAIYGIYPFKNLFQRMDYLIKYSL